MYKNNIDDMSLSDLLMILWDKKYYILIITSIFALASIVLALMLPNSYTSEALMMPNQQQSPMSSKLGEFSSIAGLAGINLPDSEVSRAQEAIARIQSFEFFSTHFLPHVNLEDLLAVKEWNPATNTLVYDKKTFNSETRQWVREVSFPRSTIPSAQESYETYTQMMHINEDKKTSFITLSYEHKSPYIAQEWVELIINKIDQSMRDREKQESTRAIQYLNTIAPTINYNEVKQSLELLQQEQIKRLMMIDSSENYVLKVLESPIAPELKSAPRRSLIVILATLSGMILSIFISLVLHFRQNVSAH
jgi:uncharacterized protein involved in exopolysaccharide biosynthesis